MFFIETCVVESNTRVKLSNVLLLTLKKRGCNYKSSIATDVLVGVTLPMNIGITVGTLNAV